MHRLPPYKHSLPKQPPDRISDPERLLCPKCDALIASVSHLSCTEMMCLPFTDDAGVVHDHDTNRHGAHVFCDQGHEAWVKIPAPECPANCGFGTRLGTVLHRVR